MNSGQHQHTAPTRQAHSWMVPHGCPNNWRDRGLIGIAKAINDPLHQSFLVVLSRTYSNHVIAHTTAHPVIGDVRGVEHKTKQKRRMGSPWSPAALAVVERNPGALPRGEDRTRHRVPEQVRVDENMTCVWSTQPTMWAGLPVQGVQLHLSPRRPRSDQYPPKGDTWGAMSL